MNVIRRPVQRVLLAAPVAVAVMICLGSASGGSTGPVWVYGPRPDQAQDRSERDSITAWLACLERVATQIGGQSPRSVAPHVQTRVGTTATPPTTCLQLAAHRPAGRSVLPKMTNLPPPGV